MHRSHLFMQSRSFHPLVRPRLCVSLPLRLQLALPPADLTKCFCWFQWRASFPSSARTGSILRRFRAHVVLLPITLPQEEVASESRVDFFSCDAAAFMPRTYRAIAQPELPPVIGTFRWFVMQATQRSSRRCENLAPRHGCAELCERVVALW